MRKILISLALLLVCGLAADVCRAGESEGRRLVGRWRVTKQEGTKQTKLQELSFQVDGLVDFIESDGDQNTRYFRVRGDGILISRQKGAGYQPTFRFRFDGDTLVLEHQRHSRTIYLEPAGAAPPPDRPPNRPPPEEPPRRPALKNGRVDLDYQVSLELHDTPLDMAMEFLSEMIQVPIRLAPGAEPWTELRLRAKNMRLEDALNHISRLTGLRWRVEEQAIVILGPEPPPDDGRPRLIGGGGPRAISPTDKGLRWLAKVQERDGHWDCARHGGQVDKRDQRIEDYDVAVTGLALLAFFGSGHTGERSYLPQFQQAVRRSLAWLENRQRPDGSFARLNFAHNIAALAVVEHYGITQQGEELAQKAVDRARQQQSPEFGGWDYGDPGQRTDTAISFWGVMALKSAHLAGLEIGEGLERARRHFSAATSGGDQKGRVWYALRDGQGHEAGDGTAQLPMAAVALLYLGVTPDSPWMTAARERIAERGFNAGNCYEAYAATMALFFSDPEEYVQSAQAARTALVEQQVVDENNRGYWDHRSLRYGPRGGRVYSTALAIMTLQVFYRYLPVY